MISFLSIILVLMATFIAALGALLIKKVVNRYSFREMFSSRLLWLGFFLYGLSFIFYIVALRGESLSVLYPLVSTTYLWTTYLSIRFLGEKMNGWKWLGLLGIIVGVVIIGLGS